MIVIYVLPFFFGPFNFPFIIGTIWFLQNRDVFSPFDKSLDSKFEGVQSTLYVGERVVENLALLLG